MPSRIVFSNGNSIAYLYDAGGVKLRATHVIDGDTIITDYCDKVIYENGLAKKILVDNGYFSLPDKKIHYYVLGHQGNNRVVIDQDGNAEEVNHFYPFGGVFALSANVQPYKYNGKELDRKGGLDWFDYGARHYDAALGRFMTMDPMAEKYYGWSPYAYCLGNPVNLIDPDGEKPTVYEAALMSKHVYGDKVELAGGWKVSDKAYQGMTSDNGFQSALYERTIDGVTEYTYATAGTQLTDWGDLKEDVTQLWGDTKQYNESTEMAETLTGQTHEKVI